MPARNDCQGSPTAIESTRMNEIIAVIDDEEDILELVTVTLKKERFRVREFADGLGFLASLSREVPDLVFLDLMLPDIDGFEVCRRMKRDARTAQVPIIMLTARAEESDRVSGLELGADDYIVKPFSPKELAARAKAVLRRSGKQADKPRKMDMGGGLVIDPDAFEATVDGKPVELTTTEFKIIQLLATRRGWVFSRERILDHLWGDEKNVTDRTVDVHIKHLRDKLGPAGKVIRNIRGVGYKLEA
jgi:DNA-binding response OmpR family regulator